MRVGRIGVSAQGKIRWTWRTEADDAVDGPAYAFFFRVPGHGRSWATRVRVVSGS